MGTCNTLISDFDKWIQPIANNWNGMGRVSDNFEPALVAAQNANTILAGAPSDVGGKLTITVTQSELDQLRVQRMTLKNFTDSIHYEVAELIDIPFTQRLEPIMQAAYDLSPKEFRTSKPLLGFIPWGSSLEEILFGAINEAGLKDDFNLKEKTKLLNEDTPSQNLSDAIYDAKFWAKEFDKAHEAQKLSEEFLAKNEKDWETKTPDEKQKLLEEYAIQLGEIYGEGKKGTPIVTSVMWSSQDTDSRAGKMKNAWGYTYSFDNPRTGVIFIKDTYGINDPVSNDIHHALNTVTHEARHQYQSAAFDDPSGYGTPADISTDWQDWSKNYWVRPMEIDARAMSAYVTI